MEQQEEKLQRKSTSSFPVDLTPEILLRLPAKSIVRFRSVSKLWSSITTDPYFIKSFATHASKRPSLLLFFQKRVKEKLSVFSIPQHNHQVDSSEHHVDSFEMTYPKYCGCCFTDSVHGLICFQKSGNPMIWNPTMRKFLTLPKLPEESWKSITVFLGYDPIESKHIVVCMPYGINCNECRILTLGSAQEESWRRIKTNHTHHPFINLRCGNALCISGVVYYQATNESHVRVIMRFDVRAEKFDMIELPVNTIHPWNTLLFYEGKLAFVTRSNTITNGITLWILEDREKHEWSWSSKHVPAPLIRFDMKNLKSPFELSGITPSDEFIYVSSSFHETFYVSYFDPVRNSLRKVEFEGVADAEFWLKNGLIPRRKLNGLHALPNHIESLVSF